MINNPRKEGNNNKEATTDKGTISAPSISLPKGGGAIRGIDEKFSANPATGTGSLSVPIFTTPSRSDFYPKLSLSYDSGSGNGPFGLGWELSIPSITRKTDKGLPRYWDAEDSDTFILSGAEDLVPSLIQKDGSWIKEPIESTDAKFKIERYRPRIEGLFARIERWENKETGDVHWQSISKDNITSVYGKSPKSKIFDPEDETETRIFEWLLEESYDDKGNVILYEYKNENQDNIDQSLPHEKNRLANNTSYANLYLKTIKYGNHQTPFQPGEDLSQRQDWLFQVVFDYGEHDLDKPEVDNEVSKWPVRPDAFSTYKAGFEIRTYRLCQRVLMFHHFPEELGNSPYLVRSTDFKYNDSDPIQGPVACYLTSAIQTGYIRDEQTGDYHKKSFPSLEFAYNERIINEEIRFADSESLENLPIGLDGARYQWVDLDGEGVSGILTEQADAWFYKRNLGNGEFGSVQVIPSPPPPPLPNPGSVRFAPVQLVSSKPSVADLQGGQQQLMDLAGDGQLDLVQFSDPLPGYYERDNGEWSPFIPFESSPNIAWNDPNVRFIDLNGDGHADILISEDEVFVWYPSRAEEGFGAAEFVRKPYDEEKGPVLVFADSTQSIYLADMSGDGLTDIARIRNGEVCYWPNLGYGRFGAKINMDTDPDEPIYFDHPEYFNPDQIRLADIDGSGTTDIIYLGRDSVTLWFNQAGNSWSKPHRLSNFPPTDNFSSVTVVDLLGNGTACIVWSSPLPSANGHPMQYIDLMGGVKPHLLKSTNNNMGAETRVQYVSSTKFYLEDLTSGNPWITKLPFPVHAVERVETRDYVSNTKLVTLYKHHHGYYDGEEREFRGFGLVEQWDTEFFDQFKGNGLFDEEPDNSDEVFHLPPVYTKTWFHTGVHINGKKISLQFEDEYYKGDLQATLLPDTILPPELTTAKEEQEACRALKGSMLRQEIYSLDDSQEKEHPYTVTETAYKLRLLQPRQDGQYAVFYSYQCEALSYHYERNPDDPRISHAMTLEVDDFGNVTDSVAIAYPRRIPQFPEQGSVISSFPSDLKLTYNKADFINKTDEDNFYYVGVPYQNRAYEITGFTWSWTNSPAWLTEETFDTIIADPDSFQSYEWQRPESFVGIEKRIIEWNRTYFRQNSGADELDELDNQAHRLDLGEIESLGLPYESYQAAFTDTLLQEIYQGRVTDSIVTEGKYHREPDRPDYWWIPSGRQAFKPDGFYLPYKSRDPFGNIFNIIYDEPYFLLIESTEDPLGNKVQAENDYQVLQPKQITDPNGNRALVAFDALGMVVGTAVMGTTGETLGDSLANFTPSLTQDQINSFFDAPDPRALALQHLGTATTRIIYDLERIPVCAASIARETHVSDLVQGQETKVQLAFVYSDGFGREAQTKIQAEPSPLDLSDPNSPIVDPRWVGTGWKIYNNKGKPVRQYEPFFSDTHEFQFAKQVGVSSTLFYDPLERVIATLHPNHTYEKVVFDPWRQETWDVNDILHPEQRYDPQFPNVLPDHTFNPVNDPDVGEFFKRLPQDDYLPTWYDLRMDPNKAIQKWPDNDPITGDPIPENAAIRAAEKKAAEKAAQHAATPSIAHLDTLGRTFLTIADNGLADDGTPQEFETRVELDIEGNQRSVTDALEREVMTYDYDMLSNRIHQVSMDAGERWMLNDVAGKPIRAWDNRGHTIRTVYDELQRPTHLFVRQESNDEILAERTVYGEVHPDSQAPDPNTPPPLQFNLRGKVYQQFDGAGVITNEQYDFKGNLLSSKRQLVKEYKKQVDWLTVEPLLNVTPPAVLNIAAIANAVAPLLETETFTSSTTYDALNRPTQLITPHNSITPPNVIQPTYNEANLLEKVDVWLRQTAEPDSLLDPVTADLRPVTDIDYNAKGQRELIEYGNGVTTTYEYDDKTFRLIHLLTTRNNGTESLQDLRYTYDPVGNITQIRDDAQQTIFFNNAQIAPVMQYNYDAIYRLLKAEGREHIGQTANNLPEHRPELKPHYDFNDSTRMSLPHPNNWEAMRDYTESYEYDPVGNILKMIHSANGGSWTRRYEYEAANNRLLSTSLPGDDPLGPYSAKYEYDEHGNMISMPHLPLMQWDFKDQLQSTSKQVVNNGGTPEITHYVYNAAGQRVRKVTEGHADPGEIPTRKNERVYLGGFEIYREYNGNGATVTLERETLHIMDDTRRIALVETKTVDEGAPVSSPTPVIRYQLGNHLGSANLELDETGAVISYEEYHPYGTTSYQAGRSAAEVSLKRYRYTGKERDEESGLYYHGARYYASWLGRWTSTDPISNPLSAASLRTGSSLEKGNERRAFEAAREEARPLLAAVQPNGRARTRALATRSRAERPNGDSETRKPNAGRRQIGADSDTNLYAYVAQRPTIAVDRQGLDATVIMEGGQITIKARLFIHGAGASKEVAKQIRKDILSHWAKNPDTGAAWEIDVNGKKYSIKFDVKVKYLDDPAKAPSGGAVNVIEIPVSPEVRGITSSGGGTWTDTGVSQPGFAAHEFGHVLGLKDRYSSGGSWLDRIADFFSPMTTGHVTDPGWEGNIMGADPTRKVQQKNFEFLEPYVKFYEQDVAEYWKHVHGEYDGPPGPSIFKLYGGNNY